MEKAKEDFLSYLNREPMEPNIYMKRGLEFEQLCYEGGFAAISNIIKKGAFQVYVEKQIEVDGVQIMLLGYLDVLKGGTIFDIKRVSNYSLQKYFTSYQHHMYLEMVPEAPEFVYLIASGYKDDNLDVYTECYTQDEKIDIKTVIREFYKYLHDNDLFAIYEKNFQYDKNKK